MLKHSALFPIVIARHLRLPARRAAPLPCPPAHTPPSQWAAHVTYLGQLLSRAGIAHLTLGNSLPESMAVLQAFGQPRAPRVLLMSSQRHASGINLQCARHVVIVHPHCTATARLGVVLKKPYSMPPRKPISSSMKKLAGSVAP